MLAWIMIFAVFLFLYTIELDTFYSTYSRTAKILLVVAMIVTTISVAVIVVFGLLYDGRQCYV